MTILNARGVKKQLDNKQCFDLWVELGSLQKVSDYLFADGVYNYNSGQPFTIWGVRKAAFAWMLDNLPEGYQRMKEAGSQLSWEEYKIWAVWKSLNMIQSTTKMLKFLTDNDLYDPTGEKGYKKIYARKFPRIHSDRERDIQKVQE